MKVITESKEASMDLQGRVAVITGATGGLGRVVTQAFAERGAGLALLSSDLGKLNTLAKETGLREGRWLAHAADLRDPEAARAAAQAVADKLGPAGILLHLVGGWAGGKPLEETPADDLSGMLDQHVWTTFHLLQAFIPQLKASGHGRVLIVSSPLTTRPAAKMGVYAAAKAAEEALVLTLAAEAKDQGVTANVLQVRSIDVERKREKGTTPEDLTAAILYLVSDEAGMLSGVRLPITGSAV